AVDAAFGEIRDAGSLVQRYQLDAALAVLLERAEQHLAALAMLDDVGRRLRGHDGNPTHGCLVEAELLRHGAGSPPSLAGLARVPHGNGRRIDHDVHRAMVTLVPSPGRDSMANSLERRRAPPSPRPRPLLVV